LATKPSLKGDIHPVSTKQPKSQKHTQTKSSKPQESIQEQHPAPPLKGNTKKQAVIQPEVRKIDPDKLDDLVSFIGVLEQKYGSTINVDQIKEIVTIICDTNLFLFKGTSQEEDFFTFSDIEQLFLEEKRRLADAALKGHFQEMQRMPGERIITEKKKRVSDNKE
jgi:hypothetical protein